ncbi:unnamed protein product [Gongylonema pulchrum]|uniref:Secreted protein n=1 Tax=Gongylonema pulchrum TaxID=637853 RepID=A0A183EPI1_9BILA|nr:unnamed protein product [Gongylonema pulchrum]
MNFFNLPLALFISAARQVVFTESSEQASEWLPIPDDVNVLSSEQLTPLDAKETTFEASEGKYSGTGSVLHGDLGFNT